MAQPTKRQLEHENAELRTLLEELYDRLGEVLGVSRPAATGRTASGEDDGPK